jgi:heme-degrading monooxygenase HmoA
MTVKIEEIDPHVTYAEQLKQETGPIVLINAFSIAPDDAERFIEAWSGAAAYMKRQPGFISAQLHRGIAGSGAFVNIAVWESTAALAAATSSPEFRSSNADLPGDVVARPHVFEKVAVPGI